MRRRECRALNSSCQRSYSPGEGKKTKGKQDAPHLHDAFLDKVLDPDAVRVPRFALAIVGEEAEQQGRLERERFRLFVGDEADKGRKEVAAEKVGDEGPLADGRDDDEGELERSVTEGGWSFAILQSEVDRRYEILSRREKHTNVFVSGDKPCYIGEGPLTVKTWSLRSRLPARMLMTS